MEEQGSSQECRTPRGSPFYLNILKILNVKLIEKKNKMGRVDGREETNFRGERGKNGSRGLQGGPHLFLGSGGGEESRRCRNLAGRRVGYGRRSLHSRHLHVLSGGLTRAPCGGPRNLCLGKATLRKTESRPGSH